MEDLRIKSHKDVKFVIRFTIQKERAGTACALLRGACEFHHAQKENVSLEFPLVVEAIRVCVLIMYACGARRPGLMWRYGTTLPVLATQSPPSLPSHGDGVSRGKSTRHHITGESSINTLRV